MIRHIETDNIAQTNKLAMAAALWVLKVVRAKKGKRGEKTVMVEKKNWKWYDITNLRRDINRLEREKRGEKWKRKIKELNIELKKGNKYGLLKNQSTWFQRRQKSKDMNKGFRNLGKVNYFKSTRNRYTQNWMEKNKVTELSQILKIISNFGVISGV